MKIAFIIAPGPVAGAERVVLGGVEALAAAGADVTLVGLREQRAPAAQRDFFDRCTHLDVEVRTVSVARRLDVAAIAQLGRLFEELALDVVHVPGHKALGMTLAAGVPGGCATVATRHGRTDHDLVSTLYGTLEEFGYRLVDHLVEVRRYDGPTDPRRSVIHNFLALDDLRRRRSSPGSPPRALALGRLSAEKNLASMLDAMARRPDLDIALDIVGDGPLRAALEAHAGRAGLSARVRFHGYCSDVSAALARADFLVMPSLREGLPMAAIEAASAGLPILATNVGGLSEIVTDGHNGRLVAPFDPPSDARAWTRGLEQLLMDLEGFARRASALAPSLRRRFGAAKWARAHLDLYERLHTGPRQEIRCTG
jgi:glycosyltransferase involved in cell wall biosynthesis